MKLEKRILKAYKAEDLTEVKKYLRENKNKSFGKNPYLRHLQILFQDGKPPGDYYFIQLKHFGRLYLIGILVFSTGQRILFFPGFQDLKIRDSKNKQSFNIHHITCERSLKVGHLKFYNRNIKFPNLPIKKVGEFYFWFGLAIDKPQVLYHTLKHKELIKIPKKDKNYVDRRINISNTSYNQGFGFDLRNTNIDKNEFLNFEFLLKKGLNFNRGDLLKLPVNSCCAEFKKEEFYKGMTRNIYNNKSDICFIFRLSILNKNRDNALNINKSAIYLGLNNDTNSIF